MGREGEPAPSLAEGPACGLGEFEGRSLSQAIAARVAQAPEGRFWSLGPGGRSRSRTYSELWARSGRMAATLAARDLPHGSPVALIIEDGLDFIPAFWACLRAGHVAVPLASAALEARFKGRARSLAEALACASPRLAIVDEGLVAVVVGEAPSCVCSTPEDLESRETLADDAPSPDLACLLATSGSTGSVKLVALGARAMMYRSFTTHHPGMRDVGASINTFPVDSTSGLIGALPSHRECVNLPMRVVAERPEALFDAVETFRASSFAVTNTMAGLVADAAAGIGQSWDLSCLRQVGLGGETVMASTVRRLDEAMRRHGSPGGIVRAGYGTTETGTLVTGADPLAGAPAGGGGVPLGACLPNVAIRIVDGSGAVVPEGTVGEVEVGAPLKMFSFYWGDPDGSARSFTPDGWWRTGDTGLLRQGQLSLQGRTKDIVVFNGRKHALGAIDDAMRAALDPGESAYACAIPGREGVAEVLGVALVAPPGRAAAAADAVRRALGRAFGLPIASIRPVGMSDIALTATGKVNRAALAALVSSPAPSPAPEPTPDVAAGTEPRTPAAATVRRIWEAVLGPGSADDGDADFFALGGESLRSLQLFLQVERDLGIEIEPRLFFERPTLARLLGLAEGSSKGAAVAMSGPDVWPLSLQQYRELLIFVETWRGGRPTEDRLVVGFNGSGSKPPIFFVCQVEYEVRDLARRLGPEQPVFGFRSGHEITARRDDEVQAFALRYVADIEAIHPTGPVLVAGLCQGGAIALAMAQHLVRRRRHVPLLALVEWHFGLQPFAGRVLFVYGEASSRSNPSALFEEPERAWRRNYLEAAAVGVPGAYRELFDPDHIATTAAALAEGFEEALRLPAHHLAAEHRRADIAVGQLPSRMAAGQRVGINVAVRNTSAAAWAETARSGLMVGSVWLDEAGAAIALPGGRCALPPMAPGATEHVLLVVTAPRVAGRLEMVVDVVEEGNLRFHGRPPAGAAAAAGAVVEVGAEGSGDAGGSELRLVIDGLDTYGQGRAGEARFVVPAGARDLRLVSPPYRAALPDERRLGIPISHIEVAAQGLGRTVDLDDPALTAGFHAVEDDEHGRRRWTDGDARIDRRLLTAFPGDIVLLLRGDFRPGRGEPPVGLGNDRSRPTEGRTTGAGGEGRP